MAALTARVASLFRSILLLLAAAVLLGACATAPRPSSTSGIPRTLLLQTRPIGLGARFHPPATGPVIGRCAPTLGPRTAAHVEVFAANRVVIVAAGIGARPPWAFSAGRITRARCYGALVTLDPTGVVLVRAGAHATLADLFKSWGQPLSNRQLGSFSASPGGQVAVFVNGLRGSVPPASVPLAPHAEIVLEVGPYVLPHRSYTFPPGS
jgi:hypothetical protein